METDSRDDSVAPSVAQRLFAVLLLIVGVVMTWLGGQLVWLGGSSYYIIAGLALIASGVLHWRGSRWGAGTYGMLLVGTWIWAFWEAGLNGWALAARVGAPTVLGLWFLAPWGRPREPKREPGSGFSSAARAEAPAVLAAAGLVALLLLNRPGALTAQTGTAPQDEAPAEGDWMYWGRDLAGQRFSPLTQITPENVGKLEKIWEFRTGFDNDARKASFEVTPLKIRDRLYLCTPGSDVIALDAETGEQEWRFEANAAGGQMNLSLCRGVAYFRNPDQSEGVCAERIITTTVDARLIALDLRDGKPCPDFGKGGIVDIAEGISLPAPGYYYVTSAPVIVRGNVIFGGFAPAGEKMGSTGGVIRGYDAITGEFVWAFDTGRPDDHGKPAEGETYTTDSSNSWGPISGDEELGLVYLPNGGPVPDWYGGQRSPADEDLATATLALDAETGELRWKFQTVHHDIWDYDIASQPTLYDMLIDGKRVPALIQPTKRGEIFVLDRRTGKPLTPVEELPVPQSDVPGEHTAKTQPFSTGMPSLAGPVLSEATMWGLTPIDQAWCRLAFRKSSYRGLMTPARLNQPTIVFPGYAGGSNWGSVAIDRDRDILVTNSLRMALRVRLITREEADRLGPRGVYAVQGGTPYAAMVETFFSPLDMPCQQPPWGLVHAIDLKTREMLWSKPFGTPRDAGPFDIPSMIPFTIGMPNAGGPIATASGVSFIGASHDRYFRAYDTETGKELWRADLPAGGQSNPMTYMSPSGRQVVVIAAGGHPGYRSKPGDYLIAYALPR